MTKFAKDIQHELKTPLKYLNRFMRNGKTTVAIVLAINDIANIRKRLKITNIK